MNNEFDNPIGSYTPLPNLDISNHHIEPRGLCGFWCKFTYITLLLILIGGSVSLIVGGTCQLAVCVYEGNDLSSLLRKYWDYNTCSPDRFIDKYTKPYYNPKSYDVNAYEDYKKRVISGQLHKDFYWCCSIFNEICLLMLWIILGLIGLIAISFWGFKMHRRILLARTERLLKMFSQGSWILALNTKNVYLRDSFVLYYLGVCNLYVRQNYDVRQNYVTAEKLFAESVDRGVPEALIGLGWMAENGWGKPQNKELAQKFYAEAKEKIENRRESNGKGDVRGVSQKKNYIRSEVLWGVAMLSAFALLSLFVNYWISLNFQFLYLYIKYPM